MRIRLTNYQQDWHKQFEQETTRLHTIFQDEIIAYEHFGSTSVEGMKAKPVIDILCIAKNINSIDNFHLQMEQHGYEVVGEWGISGRRLFRKGGENRTHHVHIYEVNNIEIKRHLAVRDYLRAHSHEIDGYNQLKVKLSEMYSTTREYSKAKKHYVNALEQRALAWYEQKSDEIQ